MDDLQYGCLAVISYGMFFGVLNLVINGWPSILSEKDVQRALKERGFKPCYKWMTFNTSEIYLFSRIY